MEAPIFFNEMLDAEGAVRPHYEAYVRWLNEIAPGKINAKRAEADALFHRVGITFAVYGDEGGAERLIPFDIIPASFPPPNGVCCPTACASACGRSTPSSPTFITARTSCAPA